MYIKNNQTDSILIRKVVYIYNSIIIKTGPMFFKKLFSKDDNININNKRYKVKEIEVNNGIQYVYLYKSYYI